MDTGFSSGPTALLHCRSSTGGFRCALPGGLEAWWDFLEPDYLRLNPLENPLRVDLRLFPSRGCLFGAADVMRASAGGAGGFLRHSRGGRGVVPARRCWVGGWVVDGAITPQYGTKRPGRKKLSRVELLPGAALHQKCFLIRFFPLE